MTVISDVFDVFNGSKLDFGKQEIDKKGINFVSRNSNNNGVVGKVLVEDSMSVFKKGDITVSLGGSYLLTAFVQDEAFVTAQNVAVLRPKKQMKDIEKWFYCYVLRENRFKFSAFGREANKHIRNIEIPSSVPEWVHSVKIEQKEKTKNKNSNRPLKVESWEWFDLTGKEGIFEMENCKCSCASSLLEDGDDIDYIGAKKKNLGVMRRVLYDEDYVTKGNGIIFICDGQGSVGYSNYIAHDFIGSTTISVGRNPNLNKYTGLFLVAVLDLERFKYSFGRKYRNSFNTAKIKLPVKKDENNKKIPDWAYMEEYVRELPNGDLL